MKNNIIKFGEITYLCVDLMAFTQGEYTFYVGKVAASDIINLSTVDQVAYDERIIGGIDDGEEELQAYYNSMLENRHKGGLQRFEEDERVRRIKKFLQNSDLPVFTNSIIVHCDLYPYEDSDQIKQELSSVNKENRLSFFVNEEGRDVLYIPYKDRSMLVVDGQHRIAGLREYKIEGNGSLNLDHYDLIVTFLLGYTRDDAAQIFFTINGTQKPVNTSIITNIEAMYTNTNKELMNAYAFIKILNEHKSSPLRGKIKMLGKAPEGLQFEEKQALSVTQGLLVQIMLPLFRQKPSSGLVQPIFYCYTQGDIGVAIKFMLTYFNAVRQLTSEAWENPQGSVILKSVCISALLRIMNMLYVCCFSLIWNKTPELAKDETIATIREKLSGLEDVDFSKEKFSGASSAATVTKVTEEILLKVPFFAQSLGLGENCSAAEIVSAYRARPLFEFRNWFLATYVKSDA